MVEFLRSKYSDKITRYNELIKLTTREREDYTTGCLLLDFQFYKDHYNIVAVNLSKQIVLDSDPTAVHQIKLTKILIILEKEKQTILEFSRGSVKAL